MEIAFGCVTSVIKQKVGTFIDAADYFGAVDGISDTEQEALLNAIDSDIDKKQADRNSVTNDLNSVLR